MDFTHEDINLRNVAQIEVIPNDKYQFAIVMRDGERIALHTQERNRLLTEIAMERESLVVNSWEGVS